MNNGKITAVIITKNEERNIERCLLSLKGLADEIIVIDSYSIDNTKKICLAHNVIFQEITWQGYSISKNYGNSLATSSYILSVDADEAISDELKKSMLVVKDNLQGVYQFNRCLNYCGQWIKHCGWYPDKKIRLFPKEGSSWNGSQVHEKIDFLPTTIAHLKGDLQHYSYTSIEDHIKRCNYYTNISSEKYVMQPYFLLILKMVFSPLYRFLYSFFIKLGFLDGFYGFFICCMQAVDVFLKYQKAIQKKKQVIFTTKTTSQYADYPFEVAS